MILNISNLKNGGGRDTNMELLRIVLMFFVMLIHTTQTLHYPTFDGNDISNFEFCMVSIMRAISSVAVNVFVMLSGWYGIRFSKMGLFRLSYQILAFSILCYFISVLAGVQHFSLKYLLLDGFLLGQNCYWFVQSYLLLYILSPILNTFCQHSDRKQFRNLLLLYFLIIILCSWFTLTFSGEIKAGLSSCFFIALYLLSRYVKIYSPKITYYSCKVYLLMFLGASCFIAAIAVFTRGGTIGMCNVFTYTSPLIIINSLILLLAFSKIHIKSSVTINFIASSSFAVYLLHEHVSVCKPLYRSTLRELYYSAENHFVGWMYVVLFMICVYLAAILLDKIRIFIYKP